MPPASDHQKALKLARRRRGVTAREIAAAGIHRQVLTRMVTSGQLERVARGMYRLPEQSISEHHSLVLVCAAVPQGVIALVSALQFHNIGTQLPFQVWVAVDRRARRPALKYPPLR